MAINEYVLTEKGYIIGLRRWFHAHPELSLHEFKTAERISGELDRLGIAHERVGKTGIVAHIFGTAAPAGDVAKRVIALRADTDALPIQEENDVPYRSLVPGVKHACDHDSHTASLLGAAKILRKKESEFSGEARLFFQPAEEIGKGAREFVEAGLADDVTAILGTHVSSLIPVGHIAVTPGPVNASCDFFRITIKGRSAHVARPQDGIDAIYIASSIVTALQAVVARRTNPLDSVVIGIGVLKAGTNYNIIAQDALLEGTTRSFTPEIRQATNDSVRRLAPSIAEAHGASATVEFESFADPLVNDGPVSRKVQEIALGIVDKDHLITDVAKSLGADNFADFLSRAPGTYALIGSRNASNPDTARPHHHELFDIDEEATLRAANLYVDFVLKYAP